jgi:hypothetical protein
VGEPAPALDFSSRLNFASHLYPPRFVDFPKRGG